MLVNENKTINMNAVSAVNVENGTGTPVLYMNASIKANGEWSANFTVTDSALYEANMAEADADFAAFKQKVVEARNNM